MTRMDLRRALCLGLAALTAFAIAVGLGIHHAFWASMPIWVVAQPWRGVIFERAIWRLLGTLIGGLLGLALLFLSPDPRVTALGMAGLMAIGAALTHLWSGVRSYMPLMSAITVAVVVIPAMLDPADGLGLGLDRLACTLIGGLCVAGIVGPFTPRADEHSFRAAGAALAARFEETARTLLSAGTPEKTQDGAVAETIRLGAELEGRARLVAAGSREGYRRMAALDAILAAGLALLEAALSASRDARTRQQAHAIMHANAAAVTAGTGNAGTGAEAGQRADQRADRAVRHGSDAASPAVLTRLSAALLALRGAVDDLQSATPTGRELRRLKSPRNPALAMRGAALAVLAGLSGSALLLLTGSFAAELTAFSIAIFALVLGSMPVPQIMAPKLATGVVLGAIAGMAYRIGIQPYVSGWALLVLTILPFIAIGALARANPRTSVYALDANMCFMLASQAGAAAAPLPVVLGSGIAMTIGTLLIVGAVMILPRGGTRMIARTEARLARDTELLAGRTQPLDPDLWTAIWGRRMMTLATALEHAGDGVPRRLLALAGRGYEILEERTGSPPPDAPKS